VYWVTAFKEDRPATPPKYKALSNIFPTLGQTRQVLRYQREEIEETYPSHTPSKCCHSITSLSMYKRYTTQLLPSVNEPDNYSHIFCCEFLPRNCLYLNTIPDLFLPFLFIYISAGTAMVYGLEGRGSIAGTARDFSLFFTASRTALGTNNGY
jgi:hypothetical protein